MIPAAGELWTCWLIVPSSEEDRQKRQLSGNESLRRTMVQSYGRGGGTDVAQAFLNASLRSSTTYGTAVRLGNLRGESEDLGETVGNADMKGDTEDSNPG